MFFYICEEHSLTLNPILTHYSNKLKSSKKIEEILLKRNPTTSTTHDVVVRKGDMSDFKGILEIMIKFYTEYERLSVHMGITDEDVREMVTDRLRATFGKGICAVAVIDGKIEGLVYGSMLHRHELYSPDYLHLSERVYAIEGLSDALNANVWRQVPPKFNTICQLSFGVVSPKAQGYSLGKKLLRLALQLCLEKGVHVAMSESLVEKTARWVNSQGFVVVNTLPLDQWKDRKGKPYFEGIPDKKAVLLLAFLDKTVDFTTSKL